MFSICDFFIHSEITAEPSFSLDTLFRERPNDPTAVLVADVMTTSFFSLI